MGFKLGNVYGKAALVKNDAYYNLSEIFFTENIRFDLVQIFFAE